MKNIIKRLIRKFGYEINKIENIGSIPFHNDLNKNIRYEFENEANEAIKIVRKQTMLPYMDLVTLYEQARYCEKAAIEGDFVECGVWKGGAVGLMALVNLKYSAQKRNLHLFDAFEEICAPNKDIDGDRAINEVKELLSDKALINGELQPLKGIYDKIGGPSDINECRSLIEKKIGYPTDYIQYHKGWFQNTVAIQSKEIKKIALLRLDGDWYESTKICLENLYDNVVSNGIIIFDDYGLYAGCKKAVDEFFESRNEAYFLHYSTWSCRYIQKK
jgi:O-methyltransferase